MKQLWKKGARDAPDSKTTMDMKTTMDREKQQWIEKNNNG
jgi:hypothetical protein